MIGNYAENQQINTDVDWPATQARPAVIAARCAGCHGRTRPPAAAQPVRRARRLVLAAGHGDSALNTSRHIVFNLSRPDNSIFLLAPLSESAGGWNLCRQPGRQDKESIFADTTDPDYQALRSMIAAGQEKLAQSKRFDMPGFQPRADWVREMERYGVLDAGNTASGFIDYYAVERKVLGIPLVATQALIVYDVQHEMQPFHDPFRSASCHPNCPCGNEGPWRRVQRPRGGDADQQSSRHGGDRGRPRT